MSEHNGIPQGTVQLFGEELTQKLQMIEVLRKVYHMFGFDPLTTPTLEYAKVFDGHHGEGEELLFHLKDSENNELVLRYDLTVPLARYIAQNSNLPIPFKRYQIDTVFRDDEVDKGHFREFTQCDGDVVGENSLTADAEIIALAHTGLTELGFGNFTIKINHRLILEGLAEVVNMNTKSGKLAIQRSLDSISKFLEKNHRNTYPNPVSFFESQVKDIMSKYGIIPEISREIHRALMIGGDDPDRKLKAMEEFFVNQKMALKGIEDLREIISYLDEDIKKSVEIDMMLARGADYYTGFIIEGSLDVNVGAVLGGGRFDNLIENMGGPKLPAVGMAFGLERLLVAAADLKLFDGIKNSSSCRTMVIPQQEEDVQKLLAFARNLRKKGHSVDFVPMISASNEEVISYAQHRGYLHLTTISDGKVVTSTV